MSEFKSVLEIQEGGTHYQNKGIQPVEYAHANNLSFFQGNVVKYVTRYKDKKGVEDVKKAIHYLQMILEFEYDVLTDFSYSDEDTVERVFEIEEDFFEHGRVVAKKADAKDISQEELKTYVNSLVQEKEEPLWYPPVEDGGSPWIEWNEGRIPVNLRPHEMVDMLMDYEREAKDFISSPAEAKSWWWGDEEIVAYRVVE